MSWMQRLARRVRSFRVLLTPLTYIHVGHIDCACAHAAVQHCACWR